ncbi:MAG: hypothetical protein E6J78_07630 [Deltaproteobacteria bacterium]|nr:MAG: hypothetical protein E6J78_07630 [Deltaproteobacteria bacterium]
MLALLLAATIQGPADIASLTLASDAVVRAEVLGKETHWGAGGGEIFTTVTLRPLEIWKGEPAAQFSLLVPGGRQGELDQVVQGAALFREGEEVVVFLERRTPGVYQVARMALGKFTVGAVSRRAVRDRSGLSCVGCGADEADALPLDELRARVLGSLRK